VLELGVARSSGLARVTVTACAGSEQRVLAEEIWTIGSRLCLML